MLAIAQVVETQKPMIVKKGWFVNFIVLRSKCILLEVLKERPVRYVLRPATSFFVFGMFESKS